ncbi:stage II sporulation protein E [Desulfoscipio gibsoniae]|uniref:stage II sporulation protein E n=1 Tax=Desulfoscipio gibsoniae TaxID=102134 RepID=UPI000698451D|nr:stage II sporulation protein E [Desulfoscipio gibsoniae]
MFEKAEIYSRQRSKEGQYKYDDYTAGCCKSRRLHFFTGLRLRDGVGLVALLAAGFLLGRAFLLGELLPFGVALVAAGFVYHRESALAALIGAALGLCTVVSGWELAARMVALVAVGVAALAVPLHSALLRIWLGGAVLAVLVVTGTGYVAVTGPNTYDYVRVLFEAIFGALLAVAYGAAFGGLRRYATGQQVNGEQVFCFIVLLLSIVAAAGQVRWGMLTPGGILAAFIVLVAGYIGGAGLGAAAGAVIGVVPGLVFTVSPAALGAFAFAGFLGGLCRGMKRIGVVSGFLLGGTLLTVYLGSGRDIAGLMVETALAGLVFLILPKTVFTAIQKNMPVAGPWLATAQLAEGEQNSIKGRLKRWQTVFEEVSRTYDQVSGALDPQGKDTGWQSSIKEIKNMVCNDCVLIKVCWEREFQRTLKHVESCFAVAQGNGRVTVEDLDKSLSQRCARPRELIMGINCCYQLWRMQQFLGQRLWESRELVSVQLRGMRGVIENLARELEAGSDTWWRRAEYFKQSLKQSGIPVASLVLYPSVRGYEVEVAMPACTGKRKCIYDVAPLLSQLTGENLVTSHTDCVIWEDKDFCTFRLYPDLNYQLGLGLARCPGKGNDISGDSCTVMHLSDGRLSILISDGMGSGVTARSESETTLSLLQKLLKVGYSRDLAIRMVNSVMMRHCPDEDNFATVDMCVADLYGGKLEMVKIGAPPSFLVRQNHVQVIQASSLPVGIVDDINIFSQHSEMDNGNMLVMVTDGVTDAYPGNAENEEWITSVLREIVDLPPQEVAELILRLAISGAGEGRQVADDMTVLVARLKNSCIDN